MTATSDVAVPAVPRTRIQGTEQQENFWEELLTGSRHVLLEARAGTGKSTSCREGMWRLLEGNSNLAIRYCCFNKKVADEFAVKCPPGVDVGTMHRFGLQALKSAFGCEIDAQKTYTVLDMLGGENLKRYHRKAISTLVSLAKNHAIRPETLEPADPRWYDLITHYDVNTWFKTDDVVYWADKVLCKSAEMTSLVDFDDMLWLAILHPVAFPSVDFLFIDECQDLNPVQHELAERLSGSGRTIVVGDPFQAIYAFRGADSDSIPKLRDRLNALTMPLTVTWRCPRSHVELARTLVGDFTAAPEAPEGILEASDMKAVEDAQLGDLVLCRANAPVIAACLKAIARRVPAIVRGRSIGDQLLTVHRKVDDAGSIGAWLRNLDIWRAKEVDRLEARDGTESLVEAVMDKAACLLAIGSSCDSPSEIPGVIGRLFSDDNAENRVTFSSVHRAKGSEARRVHYIQVPYSEKRDKVRPPQPWEVQQRKNLRYVALTRSLDYLNLVTA
jgi:hypothetical protein